MQKSALKIANLHVCSSKEANMFDQYSNGEIVNVPSVSAQEQLSTSCGDRGIAGTFLNGAVRALSFLPRH